MSVFSFIPQKTNVRLLAGMLLTVGLTANAQMTASTAYDGKSSFKTSLFNLEAAANETFRYSATLLNNSGTSRTYALSAQLPPGWQVSYRTMGSPVTAVYLDAGKSQEISIEINPSPSSKPQKYEIPVKAVSARDTIRLGLEAVLKGTYSMELTTPSGKLSEEITEGATRQIKCIVRNSGTIALENVELTSQSPPKWDVIFQPSKIDRIEPGSSTEVIATVNVPEKTIAGDYVSAFSAKNQTANASASFRLIVKASLLSGWAGIFIILLAVGLVYQLIRKYGRR